MSRAPDIWEKILFGPWIDSAERDDEGNWMGSFPKTTQSYGTDDERCVGTIREGTTPYSLMPTPQRLMIASKKDGIRWPTILIPVCGCPSKIGIMIITMPGEWDVRNSEEWLRRNIVGQLVFVFRAFELAPLRKFDYDGTLKELDWRLRSIAEPILYCSTTDESEAPEHDSTFCVRTVIQNEINSILDHNRAPIDERQEQHLRKQAQKTRAETGAETDCDSDYGRR
ncbi:hypothetical protein SCUP515_02025 [Seiridium cupressi]